jgi:twinkle protein
MQQTSNFVRHTPCESCGSSDANSLYDDGHQHCFSCGETVQAEGSAPDVAATPRKVSGLINDVEIKPLPSRKISVETCGHFGYGVSTFKGNPCQVAPYYSEDGRLVAQKVRLPNKDFIWLGTMKDALPFGAHAFPRTGRKIVVTEGELDALAMSQVQKNKWPVVSIGCGAGPQIKKWFAERLSYFNGFEEVVLMFDSDEAGKSAANAAAQVLGHRARIADLPLKDANDMLVEGRVQEMVTAMWNARPYRPEGIMDISETLEAVLRPPEAGLSWPFVSLTDLTYGMRLGEIYAVGAGTGIGKSDFMAECVVHLVRKHGEAVGYIALEQTPTETALRLAGKLLD